MPILAYQCRLTDRIGRSLSTARASMIAIDPPTTDAEKQRNWFCLTHVDGGIPLSLVGCHLTRLDENRKLRGGHPVTVIGVITQVDEETALQRRDQELLKREIMLEDIDHVSMKCTLAGRCKDRNTQGSASRVRH